MVKSLFSLCVWFRLYLNWYMQIYIHIYIRTKYFLIFFLRFQRVEAHSEKKFQKPPILKPRFLATTSAGRRLRCLRPAPKSLPPTGPATHFCASSPAHTPCAPQWSCRALRSAVRPYLCAALSQYHCLNFARLKRLFLYYRAKQTYGSRQRCRTGLAASTRSSCQRLQSAGPYARPPACGSPQQASSNSRTAEG